MESNKGVESKEEMEPKENWETSCPIREDGIHCNCWYDGKPCCACGEK